MTILNKKDDTYFYPRSPCGERQDDFGLSDSDRRISIHALLAESDTLLFKLNQ